MAQGSVARTVPLQHLIARAGTQPCERDVLRGLRETVPRMISTLPSKPTPMTLRGSSCRKPGLGLHAVHSELLYSCFQFRGHPWQLSLVQLPGIFV